MSKRKNTLNDLEEFLKLQASTLVPPQPIEQPPIVETKKAAPTPAPEVITVKEVPTVAQLTQPIDLLTEMKKLAAQSKSGFYDFIIQAAESMPNGTRDVLLINTALYLKHGDNWKQGIEDYWKKRKQ
jgi:hypothetical protein